jgi:hypothetical protein
MAAASVAGQFKASFKRLEEVMNDRRFNHPVFVKDGQMIVQEITCLEEALDFLDEWPSNRRGPIFDTARRACHRAFDGLLPPSVAREAFAGWARSARILEDVSNVLPWMTGHRSGRGGIPA